jgi:excisionase family DNA binding protein
LYVHETVQSYFFTQTLHSSKMIAMTAVTITQITPTELEVLIENSVRKALSIEAKKNQQPKEDELLTVEQAAEFLSLSKPTVYSLISKKELPFMKRSKRCYFSKVELTKYIKDGRKKTNSEIEFETDAYLVTTKKGFANGK